MSVLQPYAKLDMQLERTSFGVPIEQAWEIFRRRPRYCQGKSDYY